MLFRFKKNLLSIVRISRAVKDGEAMSISTDDDKKLFDRISNCLQKAQSIHTSAFRSAGVRYANEGDIVSGEGASYYGGRWNPVGIKAIYMSLDPGCNRTSA
jgi:hypothetical protein